MEKKLLSDLPTLKPITEWPVTTTPKEMNNIAYSLSGASEIKERAESKMSGRDFLEASDSVEWLVRDLERSYWALRFKAGEERANEEAGKLPTIAF